MSVFDMTSFIEERLVALDSTLTVGVGSEARSVVTDPIIKRLGLDLLETDPEELLVRVFADMYGTDVDTSEGQAVRDLLINPSRQMVDAVRRVITAIRLNLSLADPTTLAETEMDALGANFAHARDAGARSAGTGRILFRAPQTVLVNELHIVESKSGLVFIPTGAQTITATEMALNREGALYYFDVSMQAEKEGAAYDIGIGELSVVVGLTGAVGVSNRSVFTSGVNRETNTEYRASLDDAITTRTLSTRPGIKITLPKALSASIADLQVVGARDPAMRRDIVKVTTGTVSISGVPGGIKTPGGLEVAATDEIHIGGHTDVYVTQKPALTSKSQSNVEVRPTGRLVRTSTTGYTAPGAVTNRFFDVSGLFQSAGVLGDGSYFLRLSAVKNGTYDPAADSSEGGVDVMQIVAVLSDVELQVQARYPDPTTPAAVRPLLTPLLGGQGLVSYEVVHVIPHDATSNQGLLEYEVTTQVAIDVTTKEPVTTAEGDPVSPIPGDPNLAPILHNSSPIAKTVNKVESNVALPVVRVTSADVLDPLDQEPTGVSIPYRHPVDARVLQRISSAGLVGDLAEGIIRVYFLDPTQVQFMPLTQFTHFPTAIFHSPGVDPDLAVHYRALPALPVSGPWVVGTTATQLTLPGTDFVAAGVVIGDAVQVEPLLVTTSQAKVISGALDPGRSNLIEDTSGDLETESIRIGDTIIISNLPQGGALETRIESIVVDEAAGTVSITVPNNPFVLTTDTAISYHVLPRPLTITAVSTTTLTLNDELPATARLFFVAQGARAASMANVFDGTFYYVDVAVQASEANTADVAEDAEMVPLRYRSQGFELLSSNDVLTFSVRERPFLRVTEYVADTTQLSALGSALRINYEHAASIQAIQTHVEDDDKRPVAEDILIFHAISTFVRLAANYSGGAVIASAMETAIEDFIKALDRESALTVYDLNRQVFEDNGATDVTNPLELVGITLKQDRTYEVVRSEDALAPQAGRHFLPDTGGIVISKS